jgi:hypothetical protein
MSTKYLACWCNQYGRPLGGAIADTREEAIAKADIEAKEELSHANPNWKWRKVKLCVRSFSIDAHHE